MTLDLRQEVRVPVAEQDGEMVGKFGPGLLTDVQALGCYQSALFCHLWDEGSKSKRMQPGWC